MFAIAGRSTAEDALGRIHSGHSRPDSPRGSLSPMPIKKSELYSSIWKSCDELRGGMDASQYKDYVLVLLFVKYVSDKAASQRVYLLDVRCQIKCDWA
jgi:hypothetical protein